MLVKTIFLINDCYLLFVTCNFNYNCSTKRYSVTFCLKQLIKTFNDNTIHGFSELWFNDTNDDKLWAIDNDKHKLFRCDRTYESSIKLNGGGVMLLVPKKLNS